MIQIIFMTGSGINMYLIPKNIKTKREIFKGFGIIEIIAMAISLGLGYLLQMLSTSFKVKIFLFFLFPLITFILLLPLPNGNTALNIFIKYIRFHKNQKIYKYKN